MGAGLGGFFLGVGAGWATAAFSGEVQGIVEVTLNSLRRATAGASVAIGVGPDNYPGVYDGKKTLDESMSLFSLSGSSASSCQAPDCSVSGALKLTKVSATAVAGSLSLVVQKGGEKREVTASFEAAPTSALYQPWRAPADLKP